MYASGTSMSEYQKPVNRDGPESSVIPECIHGVQVCLSVWGLSTTMDRRQVRYQYVCIGYKHVWVLGHVNRDGPESSVIPECIPECIHGVQVCLSASGLLTGMDQTQV